MRRPDQIDELAHRVEAIGDAEPCRRDAELGIVGGDADVGAQRDREPAAEADSRGCARSPAWGSAPAPRAPRWTRRSYSRRASSLPRCCSNWLISAPETNALCPAPVSTTTRTASPSAQASSTSRSPSHISTDMALRFSGWLKVMRPTPSSTSASSFPPARCIRSRPLRAHLGDLGSRVADPGQHLVGMRADIRRRHAHRLGHAARG